MLHHIYFKITVDTGNLRGVTDAL